jgi:predicted Zn-dependent peptidase
VVALGPQPLRGSAHHELDQSNQVQIYLAHEAPAEGSADARLERIVASVLSGGSAARLFSEVREKRALCYAVASSYAADKLFGRVVAYVGTTPEKAQQSLDVLMGELDRIAGPGAAVERDEFDRARTGYKSRLVASGESSAARAAALASDHHKLGRARSLDELTGDIERTTLDEVNAYVARRSMGLTTIVTLGPEALRRPGA